MKTLGSGGSEAVISATVTDNPRPPVEELSPMGMANQDWISALAPRLGNLDDYLLVWAALFVAPRSS